MEVEAARWIYWRTVTGHRHPHRAAGAATQAILDLHAKAPAFLTELVTLGRSLHRRAADVLAYFDRPGAPSGRPVAINALPRATNEHRPRLRPTSPTT